MLWFYRDDLQKIYRPNRLASACARPADAAQAVPLKIHAAVPGPDRSVHTLCYGAVHKVMIPPDLLVTAAYIPRFILVLNRQICFPRLLAVSIFFMKCSVFKSPSKLNFPFDLFIVRRSPTFLQMWSELWCSLKTTWNTPNCHAR